MWRPCKAPSRVQWYSKLHPLVFSVCFLPCGVRVRPPLVFSGTQKLHPLVLSVFFSFFSCRPHTRGPSKRETKKVCPKVARCYSMLKFVAKCTPPNSKIFGSVLRLGLYDTYRHENVLQYITLYVRIKKI